MSTSLAPAARPHAATAPQLGSTGVCDPVLRMRKLSNGQAKGLAWAGCLRGRSPGCSVSSRWGSSARSKPGTVNGSPKVAGMAPAHPATVSTRVGSGAEPRGSARVNYTSTRGEGDEDEAEGPPRCGVCMTSPSVQRTALWRA